MERRISERLPPAYGSRDFVNQARLLVLVGNLVDSGLTVATILHDPNLGLL